MVPCPDAVPVCSWQSRQMMAVSSGMAAARLGSSDGRTNNRPTPVGQPSRR